MADSGSQRRQTGETTPDGTPTPSDDGGTGGRTWTGDVDAGGYDLSNLGALDVDRLYTPARGADVVVWRADDGTFHADGPDGPVASGERVLPVTQAAIDSLPDGRTSSGRVLVSSPGELTPADDPLDVPSYTTLDVPVTLTGVGEGAPLAARATGAEHVAIESLSVEGPAGGLRFTGCSTSGSATSRSTPPGRNSTRSRCGCVRRTTPSRTRGRRRSSRATRASTTCSNSRAARRCTAVRGSSSTRPHARRASSSPTRTTSRG